MEFLMGGASPDVLPLKMVILRLSVAAVLSSLAAYVYFYVQKSEKRSISNLPYSMILFSVIVCGMMIVVGDSVARAFGLLGALSILRFRLNIKNPMDMAAVLFAMTIGISSGAAAPLTAAGFSIFVMMLVLVLNHFQSKMYDLKRDLLIYSESSLKAKEFVSSLTEKFSVTYKIENFDELGKGRPCFKFKVSFANHAEINRLISWLKEQELLFVAERKREVSVDVHQPPPKPAVERPDDLSGVNGGINGGVAT